MNILDPRFVYVDSNHTNIRETFRKIDAEDDWRSRLDGAREVLRKLTPPQPASATVTKLSERRKL